MEPAAIVRILVALGQPQNFLVRKRLRITREKLMNGRAFNIRVEGAKYGVSFGSALAMAISYTNNHSILWAIIHGILSWLYVIYFALFYA
jgi:hypothetical protein